MGSDKLWKVFERFVAKTVFNSVRNIGSGKINSTDNAEPRSGDVIHPVYEIECKCYKKIAIFRWWDKLKDEAKVTGKKPLLFTKEVGDNQDVLVTMHYTLFMEMKEAWEKVVDHG